MASILVQGAPSLRGSLLNLGALLALTMVACSGSDDPGPTASGGAPVGTAGTQSNPAGAGGSGNLGGFNATAGTGTGLPGTGGAPVLPGSGGSSAGALNLAGTSGAGTLAGGPGSGGSGGGTPNGGTGGAVTTPGGAGAPAKTTDHCLYGYDPDPRDATMSDGPVSFTVSGQTDTTVQPGVIEWMDEHVWQEAHFQWHNIRRCRSMGFGGGAMRRGNLDICKDYPDLIPANQEGQGAGDGLEFLAMHRHMIESLKQLFPKHTEQFEGWEHFPQKAEDLPEQWRQGWSAFDAQMAAKMAQADDPAKNMSMWKSEGDFGQWIQTTSGIHGALHFKWVRTNNQDHGLGNQFKNIDNYMFWKMHGWIDKVWDRYRAAQGKTPQDEDIKAAVLKQCREMDTYSVIIKPELGSEVPGSCTGGAVTQTGVFEQTIRPIFEKASNQCTGCHGQGAQAGLTLGGNACLKSSDIVASLVNKPSAGGGQFKLVVPGKPDESWLYLKVTGKAAQAGCTPTGGVPCNNGIMPQGVSAPTLTQAEQDALRQWILDGAQAPQ